MTYSTEEEKREIVKKLLDRWTPYCLNGWQSNDPKDMYCPENKVKRFLDGLAYFLLLGETKGIVDIVTDYKDIMTGKYEIPMSSCPSRIENEIYGSRIQGQGNDATDEMEKMVLASILKEKEERADAVYKHKDRKKERTEERFDRIRKVREVYPEITFRRYIVDTENTFRDSDGKEHRIDIQKSREYTPVDTKYGPFWPETYIVEGETRDGKKYYNSGMKEVFVLP